MELLVSIVLALFVIGGICFIGLCIAAFLFDLKGKFWDGE
jgi:hypothetical protein